MLTLDWLLETPIFYRCCFLRSCVLRRLGRSQRLYTVVCFEAADLVTCVATDALQRHIVLLLNSGVIGAIVQRQDISRRLAELVGCFGSRLEFSPLAAEANFIQ